MCSYTLYNNSYYIYMSISLHKKWFTLVELLIVLSIIGVLVAGLYPSITRYLARWRDSTKITEIAQINTALVLYQVANKSYKIAWAGYFNNGDWWMNIHNFWWPMYVKSIITGLKEKWFLNGAYITSLIWSEYNKNPVVSNTAPCHANPGASQNLYHLHADDALGKYSISGYLENPKPVDIANIQLSYSGMSMPYGSCNVYGRNYSVGIN